MSRARLLAASVLVSLALAAIAVAAIAPRNGTFTGRTSQKGPISFTVATKRHRVTRLTVGAVCRDLLQGKQYQFKHTWKPPFKQASAKNGKLEIHDSEKAKGVAYAVDLSGRFTSRTRAKGTISTSANTCLVSRVTFTARR